MGVPIYLPYSNSKMPLAPIIRGVTTFQSLKWKPFSVTVAKYSHIALILGTDPTDPNCRIIESTLSGGGVRFSTVGEFKKRAKNWEMTRLREEVTLEQFLLLNKAAAGQLYKNYDLKGIIGLGIGRNWEDPTDWWCSELVAYLLKYIGMVLNGWAHKVDTYTPQMCYEWPQDRVDCSVF